MAILFTFIHTSQDILSSIPFCAAVVVYYAKRRIVESTMADIAVTLLSVKTPDFVPRVRQLHHSAAAFAAHKNVEDDNSPYHD